MALAAKCGAPGCDRLRLNGRQILCQTHYNRVRKTGQLGGPIKARRAAPPKAEKVYDYPPLHVRSADRQRAYALYGALAGIGPDGEEDLHLVTIPGPPPSKARARHGNGRTYQDAKDLEHEKRTAAYIKRVVTEPYPSNVMVACLFYRPNAQRIDADNMLKHVCDAANGIAWADDSQVTSVTGIVELDKDYPRTVLIIGRHVSTLRRGAGSREKTCAHCGQTYVVPASRAVFAQRYCSQECKHSAVYGRKRTWAPKDCAACGKRFDPRSDVQRFCSQECGRGHGRKIPGPPKPKPTCASCDRAVSHMSRGLCRDCWKVQIRAQREEPAS